MFSLINKDDVKVIANSRFVKNAVFYKDLFAFFAAYEKIMAEDKANLPTFCLQNGQDYSLEGICLFMKIYASELGFETLRLSLDYLRVIYYTIAGYSADGKTVKKEDIELEFNEYKKASIGIVQESKKEIDAKQKVFDEKKNKYDKVSNKYARSLILSKFYGAFATILFVAAVFCAMVPFTFYFLDMLVLKTAIIASGIILVAGLACAIIMKAIAKKTETSAGDVAYVLQGIKKEKDTAADELKTIKNKTNKIISEKYEYLHSFADSLKGIVNTLSFKEILDRADEYTLSTQNIAADARRLFNSQQQEVEQIVASINELPATVTSGAALKDLYQKVVEQDWLYFNNEVRFTFLKKFVEVSEKTHHWSMDVDGAGVSPFGVDIRSIAKEEIAYLKSKDDLFVASSIDKFLNTKFAKELNTFEIKGSANAEILKTIKVDYINHFYSYEKVKDYNNLFYDKKLVSGIKVTDDVTMENEKIPTYIYLKIKLLENNIGLGNSDSQAIKQIANELRGIYEEELDENEPEGEVVSEKLDILYPEIVCDGIEEDEGAVKYIFGDKVVIGYKLSNV